ncbi:Hcp family type VI secretion system effector [Vibrio ouci]|uniref:Hcp family type VI secretion system effector n=1 Tax=Vibrio ouci TaxID=2499078 RepID=A0A4Y8W8H3_9VIBR|nr:Hcp family type VI secretion system effector [Vibrio ouci]TFH89094.1 Hcp family type VI secretion system effector [Vibrio ouci]
MAHNAYLTIIGERQGSISNGCNTKDSIGGKAQEAHANEITVIATEHALAKHQGQHGNHHNPITITKLVDKSSPLIATAFARQEHLDCALNFYRTNEQGYNEKYYTIELKKALITAINFSQPHTILSHDEEITEQISISYRDIIWKHNVAGTEGYDNWNLSNLHE